ncbi:hypothetical protein [Azospirillum argentinense]
MDALGHNSPLLSGERVPAKRAVRGFRLSVFPAHAHPPHPALSPEGRGKLTCGWT